MIPVDFGSFDDPWQDGATMTEAPMIHSTAIVKRSRMGVWTVLGAHSQLVDCDFHDYAYTARNCDICNADIGKFCNIAADVRINPPNHPMWRASQHHFTYRSRSHGLAAEDDGEVFEWRRKHRVTIGNDVWIGHGAIVMPGVRITTGAVVAAGAVVTHDVAAYTIVAGVPAKLLRRRFDAALEAGFLRIAWWDWPRSKLGEALADFRRLNAAEFVAKYDPGV